MSNYDCNDWVRPSNVAALSGKNIVDRLDTLTIANSNAKQACNLVKGALPNGEYDVVLKPDIESAVDALESATPKTPGWKWVRTILGI